MLAQLSLKDINPYFLREEEKIDIIQKVITRLKELHFINSALYPTLPKNFLVYKEGGEFHVSMGESELPKSASKESEVVQITRDYLKQVVESILSGLVIKHPSTVERLKHFANQNNYEIQDYEQLIIDLDFCKLQPELGLDLFSGVELSNAPSDKNIFLFAIHNYYDGVGDFVHGWDFANNLKEKLHAKGYKLHAMVKAYSQQYEPESQIHKRSKFVEDMLQREDSPFDSYTLYKEDMSGYYDEENAMRSEGEGPQTGESGQLLNIAGAIEVSYPYMGLAQMLPDETALMRCLQYGHGALNETIFPSSLVKSQEGRIVPVGLASSSHPYAHGIKVHLSNHIPIAERSARLIEVAKNEKRLISNMVSKAEPTLKDAEAYLDSHHFMPAYLQTKSAAGAFVLAQVLHHQKDDKVCDFLLPRNVVQEDLLVALLAKAGISKEDILFVYSDTDMDYSNSRHKVRIFCKRIEEDKDYQTLFNLSADGAGASGDNSVSTVFCSSHLPFYEFKSGSLGRLYEDQLLALIDDCADEANNLNNEELKVAFGKLKEYIRYLNRFRHLGECDNNPVDSNVGILPESEEGYFSTDTESEIILGESNGDKFYKYCQRIADYQKDIDVGHAWDYLRQKITANNFYDHLEKAAKGSIMLTLLGEDFLANLIKNSREIQSLIIGNRITEQDLSDLTLSEVMLLGDKRIHRLVQDGWLSLKSMGIFFNTEYPTIGLKDKFIRWQEITSELKDLTPEHRQLFGNSLILTVAVYTGILEPETLLQHFTDFKATSLEKWPDLILKLGKLEDTLAKMVTQPNQYNQLKLLIEQFYPLSHDPEAALMTKLLPSCSWEYKSLLETATTNKLKQKEQNKLDMPYYKRNRDKVGSIEFRKEASENELEKMQQPSSSRKPNT